MAEFRKREDITQEIDLLQQWSDLGAPRMGELSSSLEHLVKTVDPAIASKVEIRTAPAAPGEAPVPSEVPPRARDGQPRPLPGHEAGWPPEGPPPPEFADLPPGDDERPSRGAWIPLVGALLLLGAAAALWWTKDDGVPTWLRPSPDAPGGSHAPSAGPGGAFPGMEASPAASARPSAAATAAHATIAPTAAPTPEATIAPTPGASAPAASHGPAASHAPTGSPAAARRSPLPGLRPVTPIQRTKPKVTEYVVRLGDSLSLIAKRELGEMERWPELHEMNRAAVADPDLILPGQRIALPGDEAPAEAPEVEYTTRPGDTLQAIAKAHLGDEGRWREIYDRNQDRLPAQTMLPPGTVLRLPAGAGSGAAPGAEGKPAWKGVGKPRHHVVKHGESLSLLARRYLGATSRWPEIYYLNSHKIAHAHTIYPGQVLAIPPAHGGRALRYVVRSGDTLWAIAQAHMGSPFRWPALYRANRAHIANPHWIYPGQVFRVPR